MKKSNTAPTGLSKEAKAWWRRLVSDYGIEDSGGELLLETALTALDRMRAAQKAIAKDGATVRDRWGQVKPHPLLPVERDARSGMLQALRQLNLDIEPLKGQPGRPVGS